MINLSRACNGIGFRGPFKGPSGVLGKKGIIMPLAKVHREVIQEPKDFTSFQTCSRNLQ